MDKKYLDFIEEAKRVGELILAEKEYLVVHHFDVDGITSGSITALALQTRGIQFEMIAPKRMSAEVVEQVRSHRFKNVIVNDLGAGFLKELKATGKKVFVLDHHPPELLTKDNLTVFNPHNYSIDGSYEACGATTAYFAFSSIVPEPQSKRMAKLGIVGAVGDVQAQQGFKGLNSIMLERGEKAGVVLCKKDLKMFGRVSRTLVSFLCYCSEPVLPGLTGNDKACALFLQEQGINPTGVGQNGSSSSGRNGWLRYYDLPEAQRKQLAGALVEYCYEKGVLPDAVKEMIGDVYLFLDEPIGCELYDAYEFSTLINSCGRNAKGDLGVRVCLGEDGALNDALSFLQMHRQNIAKGIAFAKSNAEDFGPFYFLDARGVVSDSIVGSVASAYFSSGYVPQTKPILALSVDSETGQLKASGRGNRDLVRQGLDLGVVMREAASKAGGYGGGHNVAAGCTLEDSQASVSTFLLECKKAIQGQLAKPA